MHVCNKSIIMMFLTSNSCFRLKYESSICNIAFSSEKAILSELGEEYAHIKYAYKWKHSKTILNKCFGGFWFEKTTGDGLFHWRKLYYGLWTNPGLKQHFKVKTPKWWICFLKRCNISLITRWTGVVWITCGLLWCFHQLFGLSFWRHPFTAEHPLVSKYHNTKFL